MDHAARCGHLEVVQSLHENRTEGCMTDAMDYVAREDHIEVVKLLYEHRKAECGADWAVSRAIEWACRGNQLDIVRYLVDECGGESPEDALQYMVVRCADHLELVMYLYENLATRYLFATLTAEDSWDAIHEVLKSVCLQHRSDPPQRAAHQLNRAAGGNRALLVRVLCGYTTQDCLLEAKRIAMEQQNAGIAAVLDEFLGLEVLSCSLAEHRSADGPRPCQKKQ